MTGTLKEKLAYFTPFEKILWCVSEVVIFLTYFLFAGGNVLSLVNSAIGVTALLFSAKGNPVGQMLFIVFGLLYGVISWSYAYYGEVITYLGMSVPMAVYSLVNWLRHPYRGNKTQVEIASVSPRKIPFLAVLTAVITVTFYFVLKTLHTANLVASTVSVATSFVAVYFASHRSPFFALAYAINDVVLMTLWIMASLKDPSYTSVIICFSVFLVNDSYNFVNWLRMRSAQRKNTAEQE